MSFPEIVGAIGTAIMAIAAVVGIRVERWRARAAETDRQVREGS